MGFAGATMESAYDRLAVIQRARALSRDMALYAYARMLWQISKPETINTKLYSKWIDLSGERVQLLRTAPQDVFDQAELEHKQHKSLVFRDSQVKALPELARMGRRSK